jgi:ABC-2 type transport system ATP-binding protein
MGVLHPDSGRVEWRGAPLGPVTRRRFGYMPEERGLYPKMPVGEQLAYFAALHGLSDAAAKARADRWLERLGIADRAGDKVEELSLGNQQRVQLGAALVHEPDLLVLDEPFSGLDPVGVDVLSDVLLSVAREREVPVIFSSHQLELVERLCDAVAIIRAGRLVATGRVADLRRERAGRRWTVEVDGDGWRPDLSGVTPLGDHIYEVADGIDPQTLLDAARRAGPVRRFGPAVPTLADLFRDVAGTHDE